MVLFRGISNLRTMGSVLLCVLATGCAPPSSGTVPGDESAAPDDAPDPTGSRESDTPTVPVMGGPDDPFPGEVCLANVAGKPPDDSKCSCEFLDCEGTEIACECSAECFASPPPEGCAFARGECNDETGLCSVAWRGIIADFINDTCLNDISTTAPIAFCRDDDGTMDNQQCSVSQCTVDILNVVVCSELTESDCEEEEFCNPYWAIPYDEHCQAVSSSPTLSFSTTLLWAGCMDRRMVCAEAMTCGRRDGTEEDYVFFNDCLPDGWTPCGDLICPD